jgi:phage tail sheath protein FI
LNPPESIDAGYVVCEIGLAPAKPAEFVVFRVSQKAMGDE